MSAGAGERMSGSLGPCGRARAEVETRCAESARLAQAVALHAQRLTETRRQQAGIAAQQQALTELADRRRTGQRGCSEGRAPTARELAIALTHCGHDPRALRRPAGRAALEGLWHGSTVQAEHFLAARAPQLSVEQMMIAPGPRAARLGDLWDIWGRLRPLLIA